MLSVKVFFKQSLGLDIEDTLTEQILLLPVGNSNAVATLCGMSGAIVVHDVSNLR